MGDTMHLLDVGLLGLALWIGYYLVRAKTAFSALRELTAHAPQREAASMALHRSIPGQGRGQPYGERSTPRDPVSPGSLPGLHGAPPPPLHLCGEWQALHLVQLLNFDAQMHRDAIQAVDRG